MFLTLQFPLVDSRAFLDNTFQINRPLWPAPRADIDFVRYFGEIRERHRGGLSGWVGENNICISNRALRFSSLAPYKDKKTGYSYPLKLIYRRFYFDGMVVGKYEVALFVAGLSKHKLNSNSLRELIYYILRLNVEVPNPRGNFSSSQLWQAGKSLANLYLQSSTSFKKARDFEIPKWWVHPGRPLVLVEERNGNPSEDVFPFVGKIVPLQKEKITITLSHHKIGMSGITIPLWRFREDVDPNWDDIYLDFKGNFSRDNHLKNSEENYKDVILNKRKARELRIYLLRLHAEKECLKQILTNIGTDLIKVESQSNNSDKLQYYFNQTTRRITRLESKSADIFETEIGEIARQAEDFISPGERDMVLEALKQVDVRKNIFRKVESYISNIVVQEVTMGNKYTVGQAGAVGDGAKAENINFNQVWSSADDQIDLEELAKQLESLRSALKEQAKTPEEDAEVVEVASAAISAKNGNGSKVLEHLSKAGKWALDTAQKIGVSVAAEAIKKSLGM